MFKNLARTVAPLLLCLQSTSSAQSVFTSKLDDPKAVYLKPPVSDSTDDTVAIQTAIDEADTQADEGIVFIPSGRYRLTHTAYVWPGVRVFGYGGTRPVFLLPAHTPGFETGMGTMVIFAGARPGQGPGGTFGRVPFAPPDSVPPNPSIADANSGTFYSAMSNIDFEIGDGTRPRLRSVFTLRNTRILAT